LRQVGLTDERNSEPAKTEAHQFSAAGWIPASTADLRSVLALRVEATLNLESHDWMLLTSCQPIIDALAKRFALMRMTETPRGARRDR
jgi:hypothetical protein